MSLATQNCRVVVTGMGAISPLGVTFSESWSNALKGNSGLDRITRFPTDGFPVRIAGEVKGFDGESLFGKKDVRKMDLFIQYAVATARMALKQSKLDLNQTDLKRAGVYIGVGIGGLPSIEDQVSVYLNRGPNRVSPFFIPMVIGNLAAGQVSIDLGLRGPNFSITSACASGAHSVGEATRLLREGKVDVMLAGGTESCICPLAVAGFASMKALSNRNDSPHNASRPFDKNRDGFVLSEGSAILVLETLEHAINRGATPLAEISGYGASSDAFHMANPSPNGEGAAQAISLALNDAHLKPDEIQYINAHGTSTPIGDRVETQAIHTVFKEQASSVWVSSTKGVTGHMLGAAGAIESAFCVQSIVDQLIPPTAHLENPGEDCDLDYVPGQARDRKVKHVLNNSFGFGGTNACLVFSQL